MGKLRSMIKVTMNLFVPLVCALTVIPLVPFPSGFFFKSIIEISLFIFQLYITWVCNWHPRVSNPL